MPRTEDFTIGKIAAAAGVGVETIRFYQRRQLIAEPAKPQGGIRRYPGDVVVRVNFIKRAQQLGFSLEEIRGLMALEEPGSCRRTQDLAARKLEAVETRMADLNRIRRALKKLLAACETGKGKIACPIIATLAHQASGARATNQTRFRTG